MDRLFNFVITENPLVEDMLLARELAISVICREEKPQGFPSHMWQGAQECAENFLEYGIWYWHLFLCLLLVQARSRKMEDEEIRARMELENILMQIMFG
jgi:hypothetical protein